MKSPVSSVVEQPSCNGQAAGSIPCTGHQLPCRQCGKDRGNNPTFCCRSCSVTYHNIRRGDKSRKPCPVCGLPTLNERYCSVSCSTEGKRQAAEDAVMLGRGGRTATKRILIRLRGRLCASCRNHEWMRLPIPLEIHHKNGDSSDRSIENQELLCPNCHAMTPTFKAKNNGNGRHQRRMRYAEGKSY